MTDTVIEAIELTKTYPGGVRALRGGTFEGPAGTQFGLVHRPGILFLDEPTTGLDPDIRLRLWDDLATLVRDDGLSILLTTHYLEEAARLADRVAIIDRGRVVATGHPEALKQELRGDA